MGYECVLWSYNDIENVPEGVILKDANDIIPLQEEIEKAKFSDYFRYKILYEFGGIWSDLDNICVKELPNEEYIFPAYMGFINNNLLKAPAKSEVMRIFIELIETKQVDISSSS